MFSISQLIMNINTHACKHINNGFLILVKSKEIRARTHRPVETRKA